VTSVKAAAVQISPVLYSREGTVERVAKTIIELGCQGVQFATFPETVVPYYPYFSFVQRPFEINAKRRCRRICRARRRACTGRSSWSSGKVSDASSLD